VGSFRWLQDNGYAELATSAATHGYLPLFDRDSSIAAQVRTGVRTYERQLGRAQESFRLPECAYRPARVGEDGSLREGIEEFLAASGVTTFFVESHTVLGGTPVGKAAGDAVGPYAEVGRRYTVPVTDYPEAAPRSTFQPYWVGRPGVAAIGRNITTGLQVWSADHGYPGDFAYREFHKKDGTSGLRYWRVTGADVDLGDKAPYDPEAASLRAQEHARHFAELVKDELQAYAKASGNYGLLSAAYDTELFGHWWFEGVAWLKEVLRRLAESDTIDFTGAAQFVREHPPREVVDLPEGSWGQEGTHFTWMNIDTAWMWPIISDAQRRMETIVAHHGDAPAAALAQLARELLLLESSDWPFLVTTGQARAYAELRFMQHVERFDELATAIESGHINVARVTELWEHDNVFPDIDPQDVAEITSVAATANPPVA
jgi:1,4-alpha-glucan branching enzyme